MGSLISRVFAGALSPFNMDAYVADFQAVCVPQTGQIMGFETLLRKQEPGIATLSHPIQFMGSIQSQEVPALDFRMLREACRLRKKLQTVFGNDSSEIPFLSTNLSPQSWALPSMPAMIAEMCAEHKVDPSGIKLEILEHSFSEGQLGQIQQNVEQLHAAGHKIVLDDFMCEDSDFTRLEALRPWITGVKLNSVFQGKPPSFRKFISDRLHAMGMEITMEHVEGPSQYDMTLRAGCKLVQGYRYHRPVSAKQALELVTHSEGRTVVHTFDEGESVGQTQPHGVATPAVV